MSFSSFAACVDLSGEYSLCRSRNNILIEGSDMKVRKIDVPHNTFYSFDFLPDGNREREVLTFPANRTTVKDSWVGSTGMKYEREISAACLGNLVQVRTLVTRDGGPHINETSQYFKRGENLVRISRGTVGQSLRYTDVLTCRP
jgi:hypothetical protein